MRRRDFITFVGGTAAWPLAARAQQAAKLPIIGLLGATTPSVDSQRVAAFVQRLSELGWIEGQTVAIDALWAEGRNERFAEIAAEFVRHKVDDHGGNGICRCGTAGDVGYPDSSRRQETRLPLGSSQVWRVLAAT